MNGPFPVDALPPVFRRFALAAGKAIGCDPSYLALPLLCGAAGAIGNTRAALLKRGWIEPAVIWGAVVGPSGTAKSAAVESPVKSIKSRQAAAMAEYDAAFDQWQQEALQAKRSKEAPPVQPTCQRFWFDDCTIEALAPVLKDNPRGLVLIVDELKAWVGSFDQYRSGKGGDVAKWLSIFRAKDLMIDRKTAERKMLYVPRAAVSIVGGIQPETLASVLTRERFSDGFAARLLLVMPDRIPRRWTDSEISESVEDELAEVFDVLLNLDGNTDDNGHLQPKCLPLVKEAKSRYIAFFNEWNAEALDLDADLQACWAKIEGYAPRFALVHQVVLDPEASSIGAESMAAGIALARWFGNEARRVYGSISMSDEDRELDGLKMWIERHGGEVTTRDLQRGPRQYRSHDDAFAALAELVKVGAGKWARHTNEAGQVIQRFQLLGVATGDTIPLIPEENGHSVAVASVTSKNCDLDPDLDDANRLLMELGESEVA